MRRRRGAGAFGVLCAMLCAGLVAGTAFVQDSWAQESWSYDLSHDLMSPFCPGRTLASCPSPQAAELVQWIAMQEAAGASREQVVEVLIERYGEEILGAPPAEGITLWAYIFPVLGFALGGLVAFVVLRRIVGRPGEGQPAPATAPGAPPARDREDELAQIVDAELARRS